MKQQTFENGAYNDGDNRNVIVKINNEHIEFFFEKDHDAKLKWIEEQIESGENLSQEDSTVYGFYWIGVGDYKIPERDWQEHLLRKRWFSQDMLDFINKTLDN